MLMHIINSMTIFYNKDREAECRNRQISPQRTLNILFFALTLTGILVFSGCEEDPSKIGVGLLPSTDLNELEAIDTFTINSYTSYIEEIRSYYTDTNGVTIKPSGYFLGCDFSPYFGLTKGGFVSQLWLNQEWPKKHVSLDSLILNLHFSSIDGEPPMQQIVEVYEVDEILSTDSTYYINKDVLLKQPLAAFSLDGLVNKDTVLSIKMPSFFMEEIMRDTTKLFLADDTADFREYFKGLYFTYPQVNNYHMTRVRLNDGYSSLTLYYTDTASFNSQYYFLFNNKTVSFNVFEHDFDAADPGLKPKYINQEIQDTITYIQGYNGLFTTIKLPGLEDLKDRMPIGINKARLYLPAYSNDTDFLEETFPSKLIARYVNDEGSRYVTRDYLLDPSFADGQYYSLDDHYIINITAFVQDYLEGIISEPELEILFESYGGSHLILWGEGSYNPPRLELVFTEL
jgi:hypothetical protein